MFRIIFGRDVKETQVKSEEERMICDFLFFHGVSYEYERVYEIDTVTEKYFVI